MCSLPMPSERRKAMKQEDLLNKTNPIVDIGEKLQEAQHDDTPYPVVTDDGVKVVGDANKIEKKRRDYTIRFRFPPEIAKNLESSDIIDHIGRYSVVEMTYENVDVAPNRNIKLLAAIQDILPLYKEFTKNGGMRDKTIDELAALYRNVPQYAIDGMYTVVASFLGVDESIQQYMYTSDVTSTLAKLIKDFPEVFNEADSFFV